MVNHMVHIGAAVVTARVPGGRMAGILERVLLAGDVGGLLVRRRPVVALATVSRCVAHRLNAVRTGLRLGRRAVEHGSVRRLTMASAAEQRVTLAVAGVGLLAERGGLPAVPAVDLLLVLLRPEAGGGLLTERGGLPAVPAADLLLVLLRPEAGGWPAR